MKPKKNPQADLRKNKLLYFEIGLFLALAATIMVFSLNSKESVAYAAVFYNPLPDQDLMPVTVEKSPEKSENVRIPSIIIDHYTISDHTTHITTSFEFDGFDDIQVIVPVITEEKIDEDEPLVFAQNMPSFMGGDIGRFSSWVYEKVKYPEMARQNMISGKVVVYFVIEKDGSLSGIQVLRTPDKLLSDEVVKVLASSPRWEAGTHHNARVRVAYTMPVDFIISE